MKTDHKLILSSLDLFTEERSKQLVNLSYKIFFEACPNAEKLWSKDDYASREKMLNSIILMVVDHINRPNICEQNLKSDIKDHKDYDVDFDMYLLFFNSLSNALPQALGSEFSIDMADAWRRQFKSLHDLIVKHIT